MVSGSHNLHVNLTLNKKILKLKSIKPIPCRSNFLFSKAFIYNQTIMYIQKCYENSSKIDGRSITHDK